MSVAQISAESVLTTQALGLEGVVAQWRCEPILHKTRQNYTPLHTNTESRWVSVSWYPKVPLKMWGFWTWASAGEGNVPTKLKKSKFCTWIHFPFFIWNIQSKLSSTGSTCLIRKTYFVEILLNHCPQERKWKRHSWLARQTSFSYCKHFLGKLLPSDFHFTFFVLKKQFSVPALGALGRYGFS